MIVILGVASDGTGSGPETVIQDAVDASGFNVSFDIDVIEGSPSLAFCFTRIFQYTYI